MIVFLVCFCGLFLGLQAQDKISLYNNANVLHSSGKFVEAEEELKQVLNSDLSEEEKEQIYFNLGCSQAEQKKYQKAIKSFEEVVKVNQENLRAKKNIEILKNLEQKQDKEESNKSKQEKDQPKKDADKDNSDKSSDDKKTDVDKDGANKPSQHEDSKKDSNKNNKDNVEQKESKDQESNQEEQEQEDQEPEDGKQEDPLNSAEREIAAAVDKCDTNIGKHRKAMLKGHDYGW